MINTIFIVLSPKIINCTQHFSSRFKSKEEKEQRLLIYLFQRNRHLSLEFIQFKFTQESRVSRH